MAGAVDPEVVTPWLAFSVTDGLVSSASTSCAVGAVTVIGFAVTDATSHAEAS